MGSPSPREEEGERLTQEEAALPVHTFEQILDIIGHFGKYQKLMYIALCFVAFTSAWYTLAQVFLCATPEHHCKPAEVPFLFTISNASKERLWNITVPPETSQHGKYLWSKCQQYNLTQINLPSRPEEWDSADPPKHGWNQSVVSCQAWEYDTSVFSSTVVTEWDLVCERSWMRQLDTVLFMLGCLVGSSPVGWVADRYGRRKVVLVSAALAILCTLGMVFSPAFWFFTVLRFLNGLLSLALYNVSYTLGMEFVGPTKKKVPGMIMNLAFTLGHVLLTGVAYGSGSWRMIQLTVTLVSAGVMLCCWFLPESARWLILRDREEEAKVIIRKAARINQRPLPANFILTASTDSKAWRLDQRKYTATDLLRTPILRRNTLILCYNWFSVCCSYYGLVYNIQNLSGDPYVNFLLIGLAEVPAHIGLLLILDRTRRKLLLLGTQLLGAGACLGAAAFAWLEMAWLTVGLCLVGQFLISAAFTGVYLYSAEVMPTPLRTTGIGFCNTLGRLGSSLCPWVILLGDTWKPSPFIVFAVLTTTAGLLAIWLPETLGRRLPETLEDAEKVEDSCCCCWGGTAHSANSRGL
ncbi:organic cation transporter protein-like [Amia ocellicauda]|uniref:organic cation transporter protein-like n=1 Tax=Amia ocellicauda TaxID=2972642 RepID=UPI003463ED56